jgi:membrane-bound inhibitor of C-type lysozyme
MTQTRTPLLAFLLSVFVILLVAPVAVATSFTVCTNTTTYYPGDMITVSGTASASTDVTVQLLSPSNQLVGLSYVTSGSDGSYSTTFAIPSSMPTGQWTFGTYTVKALMATTTVSTTVAIQSAAVAASFTMYTSTTAYYPGNTITVSGITLSANTDVTVELLNPNSTLVDINYVTSGSDGFYSMTFNLPSSMPTGQWTFGTYTLKAFSGTTTVYLNVAIQRAARPVPASSQAFVDPNTGLPVTGGTVGTAIGLQATIQNADVVNKTFTAIFQVKDPVGVVIFISWISGTLIPGLSLTPAVGWTPSAAGSYTVEVLVVNTLSVPTPYSDKLTNTLIVS